MMNEYHFYDTSSLLMRAGKLFTTEENIVISTITLQELEHIKSSADKDPTIRAAARQILRSLHEHPKAYEVMIYNNEEEILEPIKQAKLPINNDTRILASAIFYDKHYHPDETVFITNDLSLGTIANLFFGEDNIQWIPEDIIDNYKGYKSITLNEEEMAKFYTYPKNNLYNLFINEYLIIKNKNNEIIDKLIWTGEGYRQLSYDNFDSQHFGKIKPISNDIYQQLAADSLCHNKITMLRGPAGTGKTFLALAYLFNQLEKHKIDKIIVFCNTIAVKGAARLGFYPGSRNEKLLDSQIGNLLSSKLGDRIEVEKLIDEGKLILLPLADARGYDTSGMKAGIYISEAQNMDINLMKLSLQRIGEDSICIIDGDDNAQVDDITFAGNNNGMKRASQIFRGYDIYGEIELKNIHRSRIAAIAQNM